MPADSNPPARRTTRSTTRKDKEVIAAAAEAVFGPAVRNTTRVRTRSAGDVEKPVAAAPEPDSTRSRKGSAPEVLVTVPQRVTRSVTAAAKAAAAKAKAKPTTKKAATQPTATQKSKPKNKTLERARTQSLAQRKVRYRTPTPPCEMRQSEPATPHTPIADKSNSSVVSSHIASSPMGPSSQNAADDATFEMLQGVVGLELGKSIEITSESYPKDLYKDLATDTEIKAAFEKIGYKLAAKKKKGREVGRWEDVPETPSAENDLYEHFTNIASAIHTHLGKPDTQNTRIAVDTHAKHHVHRDNSNHNSRPDISIVATGNSFEKPAGGRKYGYSSLASFFEVKRDSDRGTDEELVWQTGVYSRQMFMYQPNRKYVRCLVLTEKRVRLMHFDRSGAQYSPWINIHEDPYTFVRLVLGLSSTDEGLLGLDTSVKWTHKDGRKVSGTISMVDSENEQITFDLLDIYPVFIRAALRGRGTTCWSALSPEVDDDGNRIKVLIKDAWRSDDRVPEYTYLEQAKGVNGISRMLHYEDRRAETKSLRSPHIPSPPNFFNRIWLRVVCKQYGPSLKHFKSQKQALAAIRDAILSHRNLIKFRQILHRDISIQNILIGVVDEDALPGLRGILIDLDMAISTGPRDISSISEDHRTGTRLYQSISVLMSYSPDLQQLAHDYLDDLESFFFVLVYLMFVWIGVETQTQTMPEFITLWDSPSPTISLNSKESLVNRRLPLKNIAPFWGPASRELLVSFHKFVKDIVWQKDEIRNIEDPEERQKELEALHAGFEDHYQTLKTMFDKALKALDEEQAQPAPAPSNPTSLQPAVAAPPQPLVRTSRTAKRGSGSMEEGDEIESPSKRIRTVAGTSRLANALKAPNETIRR